MLHVVALLGVELPTTMYAESLRDEQVKVFRQIPAIDLANLVLHVPEVGRGEHQMDARHGPRPRGIDAKDARMRVRAAETCGVEHPGRVHVVHEAPEPAQEASVLVAKDPGTDRPARQPALSRTASMHDTLDSPHDVLVSAASLCARQATGDSASRRQE